MKNSSKIVLTILCKWRTVISIDNLTGQAGRNKGEKQVNKFQHDNIGNVTPKERAMGLYNGKPYRTEQQKRAARSQAFKTKEGFWVSTAPVSRHPLPRFS